MITAAQIRSARAALRWSAEKLSVQAGIGLQTIKRLEAAEGVPPSRSSTLDAVQKALQRNGVEFIGSADDAPGIRVHARAL